MSSLPLLRRTLAGSWRSLTGWSFGVGAALLLYLPLFPSFGGGTDMQALLDRLPPELINALGYDQISTGAGYTQSTFFGLIGFALLTIAATSWGTAAIAGDEETGSLELTLAHSVSRTQVVLERSAALFIRLSWLGFFSAVLVVALNEPAQLHIEPGHAFATAAALVGLTLLSGTAAVAVGSLTGRRLYATVAGAGIAVLGYTLNAVANQGSALNSLHNWTPYHWAYGNTPLSDGADWGGLALLYGLSAVLVVIAVGALNRRDLAS